jgi:hypothetical protein
MIYKSYHDLTNLEIEKFYSFCEAVGTTSKDPAAKNMWGGENTTLPFLLNNRDRFKYPNGNFSVLFDEDKVIACSGVYRSSFDANIGIAGVRTFIHEQYRHLSLNREYFLVEQKKWCLSNNIKIVMLTFNDYNKNLINVFKRRRLGEKNDRCNTREPKHLFYSNFNEVPFPVTIQYTPQWAIYEKLDPTFEFDWSSIRVDNDSIIV